MLKALTEYPFPLIYLFHKSIPKLKPDSIPFHSNNINTPPTFNEPIQFTWSGRRRSSPAQLLSRSSASENGLKSGMHNKVWPFNNVSLCSLCIIENCFKLKKPENTYVMTSTPWLYLVNLCCHQQNNRHLTLHPYLLAIIHQSFTFLALSNFQTMHNWSCAHF